MNAENHAENDDERLDELHRRLLAVADEPVSAHMGLLDAVYHGLVSALEELATNSAGPRA
jgi:hypothetical protein